MLKTLVKGSFYIFLSTPHIFLANTYNFSVFLILRSLFSLGFLIHLCNSSKIVASSCPSITANSFLMFYII